MSLPTPIVVLYPLHQRCRKRGPRPNSLSSTREIVRNVHSQMYIPGLLESETLRMGPRKVCFKHPSRWFILKFENHYSWQCCGLRIPKEIFLEETKGKANTVSFLSHSENSFVSITKRYQSSTLQDLYEHVLFWQVFWWPNILGGHNSFRRPEKSFTVPSPMAFRCHPHGDPRTGPHQCTSWKELGREKKRKKWKEMNAHFP